MTTTVTIQVICKLLDLTPARVSQLTSGGIIPKQERGRYELVPVVRSYIRYLRDRNIQGNVHGDDYSTYKTRLLKAKTELAEKENDQLDNKLIPADDVQQTWAMIASNIKNRMIGIPNKIAPMVFASKNLNEIRDIIKDEIYAALDELANAEVRTINPILVSEGNGDDENDFTTFESAAESKNQ